MTMIENMDEERDDQISSRSGSFRDSCARELIHMVVLPVVHLAWHFREQLLKISFEGDKAGATRLAPTNWSQNDLGRSCFLRHCREI